MSNRILKRLERSFSEECLAKQLEKDKKYQDAADKERRCYSFLYDALDGQGREILDDFASAKNGEAAQIERLSYRQGMRDLYMLLCTLAQGEENQ